MSWNSNNSTSNSGYSKESYTQFPDKEEATATLSGVATTAPNRSAVIASSLNFSFPNNQTQQGTVAPGSAPTIAGIPAAAIQVARWW